jgi:hypothetical protein
MVVLGRPNSFEISSGDLAFAASCVSSRCSAKLSRPVRLLFEWIISG